MKPLLPAALALTLALGGCALMHPGPEPAAELDAAKLGLTPQQTAWPDAQWWRRYGDAQLDQLVQEALQGNPSMTLAQARLNQANAQVRGARAPLLPRVDADYALTREHIPEAYIYPAPLGGSVATDNRLALDASYELDFWGKNRALLSAATSRQAAAQAEEQASRSLLAHAMVRAYINLQNALAQRGVIERSVAQRKELFDLTQARERAGIDTQVEVKQTESALAATRVELTQEETAIAQLRNQVAALAGAGPARGQSITAVELRAPADGMPSQVPLDLLGHRPDVIAARWRAAAARSAIDAAKADFYPNVNLSAFVGFQALGSNMLLEHSAFTSGFGPAISLPIFHGGELNAQLDSSRAQADEAVANYNQTVLDAVHQTADALDGLRLLEREKQEQHEARVAIEAAYDLAIKRYKVGLGNYLTVLAAQSGVLAQNQRDTDLRARACLLDADLAYALGGGAQPEPAKPEATSDATTSDATTQP